MSRSYHILLVALLILMAIPSLAQDNTGSVVIHSDPRLAVLLKKNHTYARLTIPEPAPVRTTETLPRTAVNEGLVHNTPTLLQHREAKTIYTGKGYRVQIYNGPDRAKAIQVKTEFMRRFPGVHTYIMYTSPAFRVRIGDYRNRSDAEGMLREANSMYNPSMIVPDEVTISTY